MARAMYDTCRAARTVKQRNGERLHRALTPRRPLGYRSMVRAMTLLHQHRLTNRFGRRCYWRRGRPQEKHRTNMCVELVKL